MLMPKIQGAREDSSMSTAGKAEVEIVQGFGRRDGCSTASLTNSLRILRELMVATCMCVRFVQSRLTYYNLSASSPRQP